MRNLFFRPLRKLISIKGWSYDTIKHVLGAFVCVLHYMSTQEGREIEGVS